MLVGCLEEGDGPNASADDNEAAMGFVVCVLTPKGLTVFSSTAELDSSVMFTAFETKSK